MFGLQKYPAGLLDLFRLKGTGEAPNSVGASVIPTVEVGDMYGADILYTAQSSPATSGAINTNTGLFTTTIVGPSRLLAIGAQVVVGAAAGTFIRLEWGFRSPQQSGPEQLVGWRDYAPPLVGQVVRGGGWLSFPLMVPPMAIVVARCYGDAAGADHSIRVMFTLHAMGP